MNENWENSIIIAGNKTRFKVLKPAGSYSPTEIAPDVAAQIKKDACPLPTTEDREGYHGERHFEYWLSGLEDFKKIMAAGKESGLVIDRQTRVLDLGCASGRVLRHFAAQSEVEPWGCDISENHVAWCNRYLPKKTKVFLNTSIPNLQVQDNFFDIVFAMSVFTHIESFETSWLAELSRVIKPGGIAYVTIHDETSWKNMPKDWGAGYAVMNHPDFKEKWLKTGFPGEKFVLRWDANRSYSSNVFYKLNYVKRVWGKFFRIQKVIPNGSLYQTVLVLQKV